MDEETSVAAAFKTFGDVADKMLSQQQRAMSKARGIFALIVLALVGWGTISHIGATNNGQHTGYVTAVEQEGLIWKTWRAYVKTDPQSSQEDSYCITDLNVVSQVQDLEKNRTLATVNYASPWLVWKWQCGGEGSIIKSVSVGTNQRPYPPSDPLGLFTNCKAQASGNANDPLNIRSGGSTYRGINLPNQSGTFDQNAARAKYNY